MLGYVHECGFICVCVLGWVGVGEGGTAGVLSAVFMGHFSMQAVDGCYTCIYC